MNRHANRVFALSAVFALAATATSCRAVDKFQATKRCDQDKLEALATKLEASEPDARVMIVSEGLLDSCAGLYTNVDYLLTSIAKPEATERVLQRNIDPNFKATIEAICPAHAQIQSTLDHNRDATGRAIYDLCGFSRYDVLTPEQADELVMHGLFVWGNHAFLLESGTPPEVAKTISLALFRVQEVLFAPQMMAGPPKGLELIELPAQAPLRDGPAIYLSDRELLFNEEQLASLERGQLDEMAVSRHVIRPLFDRLEFETQRSVDIRGADEGGPERPVTIVAGTGVTFGAIVDTMYTCTRLGYDEFDFAVQPVYPVRRALRVGVRSFSIDDAPPEEGFEAPPRPQTKLRVFILDQGYRVSGIGEPKILAKLEAEGRGPDAWDRAGLAAMVREVLGDHPQLDGVIVSADDAMTMDVVLATAATALGSDCRPHEEGAGCNFSKLMLEAGGG